MGSGKHINSQARMTDSGEVEWVGTKLHERKEEAQVDLIQWQKDQENLARLQEQTARSC